VCWLVNFFIELIRPKSGHNEIRQKEETESGQSNYSDLQDDPFLQEVPATSQTVLVDRVT
jgi:hypothetical protein